MSTNLPLSRFNVFSSTDLNSVRDYVSSLFCQHQLGITDHHAKMNTRLHHLNMNSLSLVYLDYGAPVSITPGCLESFYLLQLVLAGQARVSNREQTHVASAGEATLINPNEPIKIVASADCRFLSIKIDKQLIDQQLAISLPDRSNNALNFKSVLDFSSRGGQAIRYYIHFLLNELNLITDKTSTSPTYRCFEQTLASMLIELHQHNYSNLLEISKPTQVTPYVKRAEAFMRENLGKEIALEDLAIAAKTTARTLRNAFHRCYGTSPMYYLKMQRLDRAHRLLNSASADASITNIALDCGIKHLGRFSEEYKKRFGETPSQSLRKKV